MDELQEQVVAQCRVVASLALSIGKVHSQLARLYAEDKLPEEINDPAFWSIVGRDTALRMELLGDILNGMDSVEEEDAWMEPIFRDAQRMFPKEGTTVPTGGDAATKGE